MSAARAPRPARSRQRLLRCRSQAAGWKGGPGAALPRRGLGAPVAPPPAVCLAHGWPAPPPRPCWGLTVPPTGAVAAPLSRIPRLRADGSHGGGVLPSWFSSVRESAPSQVGVRPALQIPGIEVPLLSRKRPQPPGTECGSGAEEPEGLSGPRRDPTGCPWSRARQMLGARERACASLGMGSGQVWRCPSLGAKGGSAAPVGRAEP